MVLLLLNDKVNFTENYSKYIWKILEDIKKTNHKPNSIMTESTDFLVMVEILKLLYIDFFSLYIWSDYKI